MIKNWKMATLWGVLLWVLIFVEVSILIFIPGIKDNEMLRNIIHYVVLIFLVWLCLAMYFRHAAASAKSGLITAFYFLVIGTILDIIITVPLFVKDYAGYFNSVYMWIGYAELLILGYIFGAVFAKKPSQPQEIKPPVDFPPISNDDKNVI